MLHLKQKKKDFKSFLIFVSTVPLSWWKLTFQLNFFINVTMNIIEYYIRYVIKHMQDTTPYQFPKNMYVQTLC